MKFRDDFPLPDTDWPPTREFWAAAARGELALPRCDACARFVWYPDGACRRCGGDRAHLDARSSGRGRLFSWSVVHRAFIPQLADDVPYVAGLVALDEDPAVRLVTRIVDCRPGAAPRRHAGRASSSARSGSPRRRADGHRARCSPRCPHRGDVMSDIFTEVASIDYPILDADAHVNEPPDLWQSRVPARLRARAPKVLRTDKGDVWSFDDGKRLRPLGLTATAGLSYLQFRAEGFPTTTSGRAASIPRRGSPTSTPTASGRRCSIRA